MQLPNLLVCALNEVEEKYSIKELKKALEDVTEKYMSDKRTGDSMLDKDIEAAAYALTRMNATYAASYSVLSNMLDYVDDVPRTILDVGAGTGTIMWAANELINLNEIICLEREDAMRDLGMHLGSFGEDSICNAKWEKFDINDKLNYKKDLVTCSYMLNELAGDKKEEVIKKLWEAADKYLVIIEPGTKKGFSNIKKARDIILKDNGYIVAPCTSNAPCMMSIDDWCHFTVRAERRKIHKYLKDADAPYEDEKYSYIVFSKEETKRCNLRIIRRPKVEQGHISIMACESSGVSNKTIYKNDELYKKVKKLGSGDAL